MGQKDADTLEGRIEGLITPTMEAMGYEMVCVRLQGRGSGQVLQVMAERQDEQGMTVEDCATLSRNISAVLDVEDPVKSAYNLEVSSPGLDRPLVRQKDFERFVGFEAKIETHELIEGRRHFRGRLMGFSGDMVRIALDNGEWQVPLPGIRSAKLIMNDELLAASGKQ
jgi:ribosome maturation factor RimP